MAKRFDPVRRVRGQAHAAMRLEAADGMHDPEQTLLIEVLPLDARQMIGLDELCDQAALRLDETRFDLAVPSALVRGEER
jgi:hypothetical protein